MEKEKLTIDQFIAIANTLNALDYVSIDVSDEVDKMRKLERKLEKEKEEWRAANPLPLRAIKL